jgi:hypothetical protein
MTNPDAGPSRLEWLHCGKTTGRSQSYSIVAWSVVRFDLFGLSSCIPITAPRLRVRADRDGKHRAGDDRAPTPLAPLPVGGASTAAIDSSTLTQYPVLAPYGEDVVAEVVQTPIEDPEPSGRS